MFLVLVHILYKLQDLINTNTVCSKSLKILYKLCLVLLYIKIWNIASHPTRRGFIVIAIVIVFVLRSLYGNLLNSMLTKLAFWPRVRQFEPNDFY
jgi:hypothetical protein